MNDKGARNDSGGMFGDYEIRGELGRGGTGVVYLAYDRPLQRLVALKVLRPQFAGDPVWLARFRREAQAVASLNHRNIVTLFKVAQLGQQHAIAMEYFEGMSLARLLQAKGSLDTRRALHVARQVAAALAAAHKNNVIHRDIKPHNIMVNRTGAAKVLDFGIARLGDGTSSLSGGPSIVGTPYYMSPEQCQGGEFDARTDIYSLGVTLFEMLTGHVPFTGDTPLAIMYRICSEPFPDWTGVAPPIPDPVARMLSLMTARSPNARYPSAGALLADLTSYIQDGITPIADKGVSVAGSVGVFDSLQVFSLSDHDSVAMSPLDFGLDHAPAGLAPGKEPKGPGMPRGSGRRRWMFGTLAIAAVVLVLLSSLLWVGRTSPTGSSPAAKKIIDWSRTLDFPTDILLGGVAMIDDSLAFPPPDKVDKSKIELLGVARGQFVVPAGKAAGLWVRNKDLRDFSWLRRMDPDGIQILMLEEVAVVRDEDLADIACQRSLRALWLKSKEITDAGAAHLAHLDALQIVAMGNAQITDKALAIFGRLPSLRGLAIGGCKNVTDEGLALLAKSNSLAYLKIDGIPAITDAGIQSLSQLRELHYLHMKDTSVTDACIPALATLKALEELRLGDETKITDAGIASLRAALPNCKVEK